MKFFKSFLIVAAVAFSAASAMADTVEMTLLDHVMPTTQFSSGKTKIALIDSVVLFGSHEGRSIFDLQAGFNGDTKPGPGEVSGANFIAGGFLKVSTLIAGYAHYPDHWKFLNSIEHGPYIQYDFRRDEWYGGYQVGLAFQLQPK